MNAFWHRYETDSTRPDGREVRRDLARRVLVPAAVLWCVVVGLGLLVTGPLGGLPAEAGVNTWFVEQRTPALDAVTTVLSAIGQTEFLIGACLLAIALTWWRTRQWWYAVVPGLAVAVQAVIFLTSALVVGRERPEVEQLDHAPPTSSFPSGHTGAATAFYLTLAFQAQRVRHPVARWALTLLCVLVPVAVGVARAYRGMHSLSDVLVGALNGATCAVIAWNYLRRTPVTGADEATVREHAPARLP
ncbi:phosphatase PAP2 family protein [Cellulomonas sp. zg-ZUI222]|uniref:Phosphatase PAP2 family protein n=1 Tax=Cellulomonas wangleii TaxID=2816956 RepID=A0ABX8D2D1_9CELL|nr:MULTISPECIES: phosphatase PAP2 family protein [Cellulomonas]MBO0900035.1 phosphatase PAP2 family protein [Cellulomonas sp. zg-ZUI22]MBO0921050.1 phosphatase PAP2 family protein [Cellulomonas wangleii]MBO0925468.1 phosphatase PAP2 family protein [Cellulomonas wangleii]QVI61060.1 phosphatase PAP2 family protein [Cellulomonas wangleii]